jgi:hypothetical protein
LFLPTHSTAGRQLLREVGQDRTRLRLLVLFDGRMLVDPSSAELAAILPVQKALPLDHHAGPSANRPRIED